MAEESSKEIALLHPVWAAAQEYGDFLEKSVPVSFEVPQQPGPVVSGLRSGNRVLIRRTDFTDSTEPVTLSIEGKTLSVPRLDGQCQVFDLMSQQR
jgi:hypothetical protein